MEFYYLHTWLTKTEARNINNLNRFIINNEIKTVIKNLLKKEKSRSGSIH
jgi:hypothetical protein